MAWILLPLLLLGEVYPRTEYVWCCGKNEESLFVALLFNLFAVILLGVTKYYQAFITLS